MHISQSTKRAMIGRATYQYKLFQNGSIVESASERGDRWRSEDVDNNSVLLLPQQNQHTRTQDPEPSFTPLQSTSNAHLDDGRLAEEHRPSLCSEPYTNKPSINTDKLNKVTDV